MTARPDIAEIERLFVPGDHRLPAVRALLTRVRELEAALEWRQIETAPKDGTPILGGWRWDDHREIVRWELQGGWRGDASGFWNPDEWPTHWTPLLPPPPKEPA